MTTRTVNWRKKLADWIGRENMVREQQAQHWSNQNWHENHEGPRPDWYGLPFIGIDTSGSISQETMNAFLESSQ